MGSRKCQDEFGLFVEMLKCASDTVLELLLDMFSKLLQTGAVDLSWHDK